MLTPAEAVLEDGTDDGPELCPHGLPLNEDCDDCYVDDCEDDDLDDLDEDEPEPGDYEDEMDGGA